jgi:hypothetical protein
MSERQPTLLVVGGARGVDSDGARTTRQVAAALARRGFGLVTGSWRGVDEWAREAYLGVLRDRGIDPVGRYVQIHDRSSWNPQAHATADDHLRIDVAGDDESYAAAIERADAGLLVAGLGGTARALDRLIEVGKPGLPLPLTGGDAMDAYKRLLDRTAGSPVPGLTRTQFLRLAQPLDPDCTPLFDVLDAALRDRVDVFVSYRRRDIPGTAGRLKADLGDRFGARRVFFDVDDIDGGARFTDRIAAAVAECRVLVCLIGPSWQPDRLHVPDDLVHVEISTALRASKVVIPVLAFGGQLPERGALPDDLREFPLSNWREVRDESAWASLVETLVSDVREAIDTTRTTRAAPAIEGR